MLPKIEETIDGHRRQRNACDALFCGTAHGPHTRGNSEDSGGKNGKNPASDPVGLAGLGVPEAVLAPLTALVADEPDGIRESLLVGVFLLCAFEGYPFRAREGLQKWFIRRGGVSPEDALAVREAVQVLKAEECFVVQGAGKHGSVTLRDGVVRQSRPANDAFLRSV